MLVLAWAILNSALFIVFLGLCFRATSLTREKFGLVASIVFVIGLLSFAGGSKETNKDGSQNSKYYKTWTYAPEQDPAPSPTLQDKIDLERTLICDYQLGIRYRRENGSLVPVSSYC